MPHKPRLFLPGLPHHIVARGHNRNPIVALGPDYQAFVEFLDGAMARYDIALHAWVLMTNHIHLLATPGDEQGIPRAMQWLGARYANYFNKCYGRSGSIWEGRYKPSVVDTDRYLLLCYRYIEMNPVRAGMVAIPGAYPWSSYRRNAGDGANTPEGLGAFAPSPKVPRLTPHELYWALGRSADLRQEAYRALFHEVLDEKMLSDFRNGHFRARSDCSEP